MPPTKTVSLDERRHSDGCPGTRVERFNAMRPARPDQGERARQVVVIRCIECGGADVRLATKNKEQTDGSEDEED